MGIIGRLFGSPAAIEGMVQGVTNGLDALIYTEEEKAGDRAKAITEARSMIVNWMDKTQGQNLSRRILAIIITLTWLIQYAIAAGLNIAVIWVESVEMAAKIKESAAIVGNNADSMTGAMMLILAFYFAAPHMAAIVGPAMERFGKKK